jgi:hypothetical protein
MASINYLKLVAAIGEVLNEIIDGEAVVKDITVHATGARFSFTAPLTDASDARVRKILEALKDIKTNLPN